MRSYFQWFTILGLSAISGAAPLPAAPAHVAVPAACATGPYCSRTDRKTEAYPQTPPELGAAGSIITDPSFGSRILRVTDEKTDPVRAGRPLLTPSSAEQNTWNTDSTMFYVTTSGGSFLLYDFDPEAMKARPSRTPKLNWGAEPQFSFSQKNVIYGISHPEPVIQQYDTASGRVSDINRPSKCVKLDSRDTGHTISVSADDSRFMTSLGPKQDENYLVYIYDRNQGCRWYNPQTGEIGGDWGPKGTISFPDRFSLHNARIAKSGKYVYATRGGGGSPGHRWVVWEVDSLKGTVCSRGCTGHHVMGYSHILGASGLNHPMDLVSRPLDRLDDAKSLISGLEPGKKQWYDSHFSWNNVDPNDSAPVCFSTYFAEIRPPRGPLHWLRGLGKTKLTVQRRMEKLRKFGDSRIPTAQRKMGSGPRRAAMYLRTAVSLCSRPTGRINWGKLLKINTGQMFLSLNSSDAPNG